MKNKDKILRQIIRDYLAAAELWRGCDWTTNFGRWHLDLDGLHSKQTRLLAAATSGDESLGWAAATKWLEQVERDARDAQSAASAAVDLLPRNAALALARINAACDLESKYRSPTVWGPLRNRIAYSIQVTQLAEQVETPSPNANHPSSCETISNVPNWKQGRHSQPSN